MQTVIVTGISGAGKTQTIDYLEDFGFFCIDNMPIRLLPQFLKLCTEAGQERVAVVSDIRSLNFTKTPEIEEILRLKEDTEMKILFLEADDPVIVKRYQQSRRKHPLSSMAGSLERALDSERKALAELRKESDEIIDTTELKPADLYEKLQEIFDVYIRPDEMQLNIISFGFKYGTPRSADFVFDARFLPNPFYIEELKRLSGEDEKVREYVMTSEVAKEYLKHIESLIEVIIPSYIKVDKTVLTVAFGCTGGQHRSVTFAYLLAEYFRKKGFNVSLEHRDIKKDRERDKYKYE